MREQLPGKSVVFFSVSSRYENQQDWTHALQMPISSEQKAFRKHKVIRLFGYNCSLDQQDFNIVRDIYFKKIYIPLPTSNLALIARYDWLIDFSHKHKPITNIQPVAIK